LVFVMKLAVVRIRGSVNVPRETRRVLDQLGLKRPNNVVLVDDNETYLGMLQSVRHLVTYGPPSQAVLEMLLRKRGEVRGFGRLTDEYLSGRTAFASIAAFAEALHKGKASLDDVPGLKRTFRCSPPSKGYRSVKKSVEEGGAFGNRGDAIDSLLKQMI